jgi:class 3 adenylate cyclase
MKRISSIIFSCVLVCILSPAMGQNTVRLGSSAEVNLGPHLEYFIDSSNTLTASEAITKIYNNSGTEILNLANQAFPVWIRFSVESEEEDDYYLIVDNAMLANLELYDVTGNVPTNLFSGGFVKPFHERPIKAENFHIHLNIPKGASKTYYLKAASGFPLMVPLTLAAKEKYVSQNQRHNLFWGLYIGIIFFAFLYNLFIYSSVRERNYLYYILYILGSSIFYLGLQGFSFKYLWPNSPMLNTKLGAIISITNIIITLFSMRFLQISKQQKWMYYTGVATMVGYALIALVNLTPMYPLGLGLAQMLSLVTCIYFIYAAVRRYRQGVNSAKFYLIGWTIFLILVMIYILTINGVIPGNFFTTHSIFIGHMTEVLLLSFALADRINILKKENDLKQKEIIRQLEENEQLQIKVNRELEEKVRERTAEVVKQKNEAEVQRARSDELLLNILPAETAEELKSTGKARAKHINHVTVLFSDIQNFTTIAEALSPTQLVDEINQCFSKFDEIMAKHGVEKIKTIGDSYMAAGGLPAPNDTHAFDVVEAALEIQEFIDQHVTEMANRGMKPFRIRVGIHTGPVVAGIVGIKKFAYDIWGDTVNLASRMESSGEVGEVNISEATYQLVKDKYDCIHRGKLEAKHKGLMDMYFVRRKS